MVDSINNTLPIRLTIEDARKIKSTDNPAINQICELLRENERLRSGYQEIIRVSDLVGQRTPAIFYPWLISIVEKALSDKDSGDTTKT